METTLLINGTRVSEDLIFIILDPINKYGNALKMEVGELS